MLVVQTSEKVYWREPKFSDNVKIVQVAARTLPGKEFSLPDNRGAVPGGRQQEDVTVIIAMINY